MPLQALFVSVALSLRVLLRLSVPVWRARTLNALARSLMAAVRVQRRWLQHWIPIGRSPWGSPLGNVEDEDARERERERENLSELNKSESERKRELIYLS